MKARNFLFLSLLIGITLLAGCSDQKTALPGDMPPPPPPFDAASMKETINKNSQQWGEALRTKDLSIIENIYDEQAHYLPDDDNAVHGLEAITATWETSMSFMSDLKLNMETLEGTKDLLYETGNGAAMILNETGGVDTFPVKYVNVWKLQPDGSYKVVIDTYNGPLPPPQ